MPAQLTTKAQVNGYRFLLRRLDHALVRRDVRMLHDPMRSQSRSLMVGVVLGILIIAGAAILAFLKPQGSIGDALIVSGKESGALYVVVKSKDGSQTLHPVLNLASARLITKSNAAPHQVKDSKLNDLARGPLLGIPGAPGALPGSGQGSGSAWTLCEQIEVSSTGSARSGGATTTVVAGGPDLGDRIHPVGSNQALLVEHDGQTYLVYDGHRARLDPTNSALVRTLGLSAHRAREVGPGLLNATSEVPPVESPTIAGAGQPGPGPLSNVPVGGVISVAGLNSGGNPDLYVVLGNGVQPISSFTAELIRNANSQGMNQIAMVPPDVLDRVPQVHTLRTDEYPSQTPAIADPKDAPVACVSWTKNPGTVSAGKSTAEGPAERAAVTLLAGTRLPVPDGEQPVEMTTADGSGDRVDAAYIEPGSGEYVQVTGMEPGSMRRESLFYVADNGIRYGIPDAATAGVLGLGSTPHLAPWSVVGQLVPGPTLSAAEALHSHDTLPSGNGSASGSARSAGDAASVPAG
ncbi:type VII secretion protein EccB [Nocardia sp. BMG51109]|uniref:type VII secretion protein EccB n=1 Tax=Nocardia sp. BMG51109 TaxID=1056816 RepID=UPI000464D69E|nr:type VII secretion protein EccB [Nocardia sp. BMG51109]